MADGSEEHVPAMPARTPARMAGALRLVAVGMLVAVGVGLAVWAVRSVFRTGATEVSIETSTPSQRIGVEQGDIAPLFEVPGYDGHPLRLAAFRGHPILLNFWASWCLPCRAEAANLEAAYLKYKSRGMVFIGVDLQNDTWGDSRAFLQGRHITYPQGRDETGKVGRTYRVVGIPTTYFIGADGRIKSLPLTGGFTGEDGVRDLAAEIEKLLK